MPRTQVAGRNKKHSTMSILELDPVIFGSLDEQIHWLQGKDLIARQKLCPVCSQQMDLQTRNDVSDKRRYITVMLLR